MNRRVTQRKLASQWTRE